MLRPRPELLACHECDALYPHRHPAPGEIQRCRRCGATLARGHWLGPDGQLALAVGALVVLAIASLSEIVTLELQGIRSVATLFEAIVSTWSTGEHAIALIALATAFGFPVAAITLRLWVLLPLAAGRPVTGFVPAMRALRWVMRWSMVEVFMLGVLIAVVRSAGITQVVVGPGLVAYVALTVLLAAIQASGEDELWRLGGVHA
jgi:paraquat-inducible protein A